MGMCTQLTFHRSPYYIESGHRAGKHGGSHLPQIEHPKLSSGLQTKVKPLDTPLTTGAALTSSASTAGDAGRFIIKFRVLVPR